MTYEGWSNYETWAVKLHIDNEQDSYEYWQQEALACHGDRDQLASLLKHEHEEALPELNEAVFGDLLGAALSEVDWHEIAETLLQDLADEEENAV
jgi:hypothetical protein